MNLRQLEVFQAVMHTGSVTAAANHLNVSQPTVSIILRHSEEQIGFPLFQRIGNRLHPTPEARKLFPDVDAIFSRVKHFTQEAKNIRDGRSGLLQVAGTPAMSRWLIMPALKHFCAAFPSIQVFTHSVSTAEVISAVSSHRVDLGLSYYGGGGDELKTIPLHQTRLCCVMRSDHPLAGLDVITPNILENHRVIANVSGTPLRTKLESSLRARGDPFRVSVEASTLDIYELCRLGTGVGIVDTLPILGSDNDELLVKPLLPEITVQARAMLPPNQPESLMTGRFVKILKVLFGGELAHSLSWATKKQCRAIESEQEEFMRHMRRTVAPATANG
jgi:DNA-binding transcriptional LysR family regulator